MPVYLYILLSMFIFVLPFLLFSILVVTGGTCTIGDVKLLPVISYLSSTSLTLFGVLVPIVLPKSVTGLGTSLPVIRKHCITYFMLELIFTL